ncbi:sigma-70 family RNA polymerase sigma factor [Fredinandcohnia humi]
MKTDLQLIGEESKHIWVKFWETVKPYRNSLWTYCLKLTGTPWDAEDLLQDTLLKSFASLSALSHREQPLRTKSFLFRVATNHWLDQCRRNKRYSRIEIDETHQYVVFQDTIEVNDAIFTLLHHLTPKQVVVFILVESFQFTAKEVAELLSTTEGSVNGLLNRARKKLKELKNKKGLENGGKPLLIQTNVVENFLQAYNRKDFKGLAALLLDNASFSFVEMNSTEYGKDTIITYSLNPNKERAHENITASAQILWGKQAIIFIKETELGTMLFDVNTIEWEDGKVSEWKCYYFCRDFMKYAADYLGLPLAEIE